jgi:hypothetical protein
MGRRRVGQHPPSAPIVSYEALATYAGGIQPWSTIVDAKFPGATLLGATCRVREKLPV